VVELFEFLDEQKSPFTAALFAMIGAITGHISPLAGEVLEVHPMHALADLDANGIIEFEEFLRALCTYCMYTEEDILHCKS
jgi:hypothetical protein